MPEVPKFPWFKLVTAIVGNLPPVKKALAETLSGFERDPGLVSFVGQFQTVSQKDCLICLAHRYVHRGTPSGGSKPPEHWCPTRENVELCGCGKPGVRQGQFKGITDRKVCEEFPGCIPSQSKQRSKR